VASGWGFTAASVALGSTYFQRLLDTNEDLGVAVRGSALFSEYVGHMRSSRCARLLAAWQGRPCLPVACLPGR
jgi:hypothetical protein